MNTYSTSIDQKVTHSPTFPFNTPQEPEPKPQAGSSNPQQEKAKVTPEE